MYRLQQIDPETYTFKTDLGVSYLIGFSSAAFRYDDSCVLRGNVEEIAFDPISGDVSSHDRNISATICELIKYRCQTANGAIIYVCSHDEKKSRHRAITFRKWAKEFNDDTYYFKSITLKYLDATMYAGIIVQQQNPDALDYIAEFDFMVKQIENKM